jgi:hypothetical protein
VLERTKSSRGEQCLWHIRLRSTPRALDANTKVLGNQALGWGATGIDQLSVRPDHLGADVYGDGRMSFDLDLRGALISSADVLL